MLAIIFYPTTTLHLGSLVIYTWGLLVSIGIVLALLVAWYLAKVEKINFDHVLNLTLISIIFGFIGSRLLYIFLEPNLFQKPIEMVRIWDGGLSLYGGLLLAIFVDIIYVKINKLDLLKYADFFVIPLTLALFFGRLGCTLVNDHLGKLTNLPWGITVDGLTRHPISAYEALGLLILFIILIIFRRAMLKSAGFAAFFSLCFYTAMRFIKDNFQDFGGKTQEFYLNQIFLLIIFIISSYFLYKKIMWYNKNV